MVNNQRIVLMNRKDVFMLLSKSKFLRFKQCPKSLSLLINSPELISEDSDDYLLETGNKIGVLARDLFPGGTEIKYNPSDFSGMAEKTQELMEDGVTTIYEATFMVYDSFIMVDIFHYDEGWHVYEVKSGTTVEGNKKYLDDVSFQMNVLNQLISDLESVNLITLSREYKKQLHVSAYDLFKIDDISEQAVNNQRNIDRDIKTVNALDHKAAMAIDIGKHCNKYGKTDSVCPFKSHCWSHVPDYSVFDLRNARGKQYTLYDQGILNLEDIPASTKLTDKQTIQIDSYIKDRTFIDHEEIRKFMSILNYPLYFLDFESINPAIPLYEETSPYDQVPFQYSLHIMTEDNLSHVEFLAEAGVSPLRAIAVSLVENIPYGATSVAYYMAYEKTRLKELAILYEDLSEHLLSIRDNMVDLYEPFNKMWYYAPAMKGSASIKSVLPALFPDEPELNYKSLTIQNGTMAMRTYETLHLKSEQEIEMIRKDLLAYCKLDTLAMVKIYEKLLSL